MASPHPNQPYGRSDNRADYQAAFLQRVHRLLQLAYESLTPSDYESAEEDDITGDLCKHMKHLTEIEPSERWMVRFSVHDQDPSNDVLSAKTGLPRKGKRRPKIDVRIVCKHQTPNRGYCIEAKRLYRSDSVSEYVDDEGVGAFICGDYAKDDEFGGMMGYIQAGKVTDWTPKIEAKLGTQASTQKCKEAKSWTNASFARGPKHCFSSKHMRDSGREITLIHVLFLFR
ncbi:MAG: hypothetical protein R3F13_04145 [Prosthecobacter sp.]